MKIEGSRIEEPYRPFGPLDQSGWAGYNFQSRACAQVASWRFQARYVGAENNRPSLPFMRNAERENTDQ